MKTAATTFGWLRMTWLISQVCHLRPFRLVKPIIGRHYTALDYSFWKCERRFRQISCAREVIYCRLWNDLKLHKQLFAVDLMASFDQEQKQAEGGGAIWKERGVGEKRFKLRVYVHSMQRPCDKTRNCPNVVDVVCKRMTLFQIP